MEAMLNPFSLPEVPEISDFRLALLEGRFDLDDFILRRLRGGTVKTTIYQAPLEQTALGFKPTAQYEAVWVEEDEGRSLEDIWVRFQRVDDDMAPPVGYAGRSLSLGDVVRIGDDFFTLTPTMPPIWIKLNPEQAATVDA